MTDHATHLPTRKLGGTHMEITRVGFGAWAVGGGNWASGWGDQSDDDSVAAIRHAVDLGINWVDTAAVYGYGHSETVVGRAIAGIPADRRPYIITKCGLVWDENDRTALSKRIANRASLMSQLDGSLKRLGVESIDLLLVHWPAKDGTTIEDYWQTLLDMKASGKVGAVGLSNHDVPALEAAEKVGHVDAVQPPFSAIRRDAAGAELKWAHEHGAGAIVYSPMQSGLLTGTFTCERAAGLPRNDWRSRAADFTGEGLARNLALADALRPIAAAHGVTPGAVAIAWVLSWPSVTGAIVGARAPQQVDGWISAASLALSATEVAAINEAIKRTGAGSGPVAP
jgi:aryl-alcohol dehydrogenase-like predicted oxidoreductase